MENDAPNDSSKHPTFIKNRHFLVFLNKQFKEIKKQSLLEYYLEKRYAFNDANENQTPKWSNEEGTQEKRKVAQFFKVVLHLLEEKQVIRDIKDDSISFTTLLNYHEGKKDEKQDDDVKHLNRFYKDDLICNIISYWKISKDQTIEYKEIKDKLINSQIVQAPNTSLENPVQAKGVFEMLFHIIEGKEDDFVKNFPAFRKDIFRFYEKRYKNISKYDYYTTNFMIVFFNAALKNDRRKVISLILNYEDLNIEGVIFPENFEHTATYNHAASQLLQSGYSIGSNEIPLSWITPKVMKDFLNSRIAYKGQDLIQIDCSFLLDPDTRMLKITGEGNVAAKLEFCDDINSLNFLVTKQLWLIHHPVVATYIDLKMLKYDNIMLFHFLFFLFVFVAPFFILLKRQLSVGKSSQFEIPIELRFWMCVASIMASCKEMFQFKFINSSWSYFKKITNWIEMLLILLSFVFNFWLEPLLYYVFILLVWAELLCLNPIMHLEVYTMIIKNVAFTFLKFFAFAAITILPFSFAFTLMFAHTTKGDFNVNFANYTDTVLKLTTMLTGEYSIKIQDVDVNQKVLIASYVFVTMWLYALVIGFSTNDVKNIKTKARKMVLLMKAEKIIMLGNFYQRVYKWLE